MAGPLRRATLVETSVGPVHVVVHTQAVRHPRDTAVILLPPFGWDDICSYRPRRDWADALAGAGYLAVRLSYPSAGDSGGVPGDPHLLDAWTDSVAEVARWQASTFARPRLALVGIELGGLLACRSVARGLEVADLVLWGAPATGRQFVRRMQAFSNLEATADDSAPDPVADVSDGVSAGGFRLSEETADQLRALDVASLPNLGSGVGRVLLLGRDQLAPDSRLRNHLAETGAELTRAIGNGYSAMTAPSFEATTPYATIETVNTWLDTAAGALPAAETAPTAAILKGGPIFVPLPGGATVRESQLRLQGDHGELSGVLAESTAEEDAGLCLLFLDTGTIRRVGPNRMWVEAARRWAARGVRSVRFDMDGMGDSDGDSEPYRDLSKLYDPWLVTQVTAVMKELNDRGLAERFAIVGLSAGAYWALHAGLAEERVAGIALINPGALVWDPGTSALGDFRTMRTIARTQTISLATLRKALGPRGFALAVWLVRAAFGRLLQGADAAQLLVGRADEMREATAELRSMTARRLLVFCDEEPSLVEITELRLYDGLVETEGLEVLRIPTGDHTVRPLWAQRQLHAGIDRWVETLAGPDS
jgi:pimeloyl-ACP methyl ester carboxylesterase